MAARYVLKKSGDQFHFTLKAANGEKILSSERYTTKAGAENGIASVKDNSPTSSRYEKKTASNGQPMFNLKAENGKVIGTSETYSSVSARDDGIETCRSVAPGARVDDET